jgi:hypothetical protein
VWKLDRLGRHLRHLVTLVEDLRHRDIGLKVLTGQGAQIDTTTANGRLVFGIFAALAEFEAELIRERTQAGLAAARARGPAPEDDARGPADGDGRARRSHHAGHGGGASPGDQSHDPVPLCPWGWLPQSLGPRPRVGGYKPEPKSASPSMRSRSGATSPAPDAAPALVPPPTMRRGSCPRSYRAASALSVRLRSRRPCPA